MHPDHTNLNRYARRLTWLSNSLSKLSTPLKLADMCDGSQSGEPEMAVFRRGRVWWYDFRTNGIRVRESTNATTRAAALQAEALRRSELAPGRVPKADAEPSPRFLDFAYAEFAEWCANEHREHPSTYQRYMASVKALAAFFGSRTLDAIDAGLVERFKLCRSQRPRGRGRKGRLLSPCSVNRDLAVLRILFNFAVRLGKAQQNPVSSIKLFREPARFSRVLSQEEEVRYLRAASPLLRDVATVILETGLRPGEVCQLRVSDVDLRFESLWVRKGKTASAQRHVPLTRRAFETLVRRVQQASGEWLFPSPTRPGHPVTRVNKAHEAALRRAGVTPPFRLYDLRHTALTRMAMSGIDLATLKELAGHTQIQMTMRYLHPTPEHKRLAVARFEAFLRGEEVPIKATRTGT